MILDVIVGVLAHAEGSVLDVVVPVVGAVELVQAAAPAVVAAVPVAVLEAVSTAATQPAPPKHRRM